MSKLIQKKAVEQARIRPSGGDIKQKRKRNDKADDDNIITTITNNDNPIVIQKNHEKVRINSKKTKVKVTNSNNSIVNDLSDVIYLGHLPHGFYEIQLKNFFIQFGIVRKVKLFRSPKTGGSRGFAFIQFESNETAQIVADAMNDYYLHDRQLVSHIIPKSKHHEGMWKMKKPTLDMLKENEASTAVVINNENTIINKNDITKKNEKLLKGLIEKQKRLNELGFDFKIPNLAS